ncbi:MAG TPA: ferritin-like domain-containing protein [Phycisphaerae bacterium]|jgi:ferritin-like metal-binding protein YciE
MKIASLEDLYVEELKDLYNAESQIVKALPKLAKAATAPELQEAFQEHLEQTRGQVDRLDQIFERRGRNPGRKKCTGMQGIIEEGKDLLDAEAEPAVLDAGLIAAAQKVEHYEIAGYGCAKTFAAMLGHDDEVSLLEQSLAEEKQTDKRLTELAENMVNVEALETAGAGGESEVRSGRMR